jgi:hypothetical protein
MQATFRFLGKSEGMKKHMILCPRVWLGAVFVLSTVWSAATARAQELSQILRGYEIAEVQGIPLNLKGKDWALVGLGSYLVNTTGCNDCHTHPNWADRGNPYLGEPEQINTAQYLTGGRTFGLDVVDQVTPVVSANLTPDKKGRPAGLTLGEFLKVMRTGQDPDVKGRLLKVMPWPLYQWKTDRDLIAMYEYLRAIPSLPDNPNPGP